MGVLLQFCDALLPFNLGLTTSAVGFDYQETCVLEQMGVRSEMPYLRLVIGAAEQLEYVADPLLPPPDDEARVLLLDPAVLQPGMDRVRHFLHKTLELPLGIKGVP